MVCGFTPGFTRSALINLKTTQSNQQTSETAQQKGFTGFWFEGGDLVKANQTVNVLIYALAKLMLALLAGTHSCSGCVSATVGVCLSLISCLAAMRAANDAKCRR